MPKIRNIIIFVVIAAVFAGIYIYFIKPPGDQPGLISSPSASVLPDATAAPAGGAPLLPPSGLSGSPFVAQDFLTLLLNVNNIKLDDSIFSDPAFASLHDSSITLIPDGTEGRPNPFAPFDSNTPTSTAATTTLPSTTAPKVTTSGTTSGSTGTPPPSSTVQGSVN